MIIDTHAHLNLEPLYADWLKYVDAAYQAGLKAIVIPGADLDTSRTAVAISQAQTSHDSIQLLAAVGIHPEEINPKSPVFPPHLSQLNSLIKHQSVVAVGEVGLDYHQLDNDPHLIEIQRCLFREQLSLAKENDLAVIIHTRRSQAIHDACDDIASVYGSSRFRGVFHCFTGGLSHYQHISQTQAYIGVGGLITYSHNRSLQKVITAIPSDRLVLETDSPWLLPHPKKEVYNQPSYVTIIALKLAELTALPLSQVLSITTSNAQQLFRLR